MPSPFPGMDPYVERGDLWLELHNRLMVYACDALQPALPKGYVARLELRVYFERHDEEPAPAPVRVPDLEVVRTGAAASREQTGEPAPPFQGYWVEAAPVEHRELYITLRTMPGGELVTAVELLSPTNKRPGEGRAQYLQKQREFRAAGVNLVEVDLLRGGLHTVAVEEHRLSFYRPYEYLYCVYRASRPMGYEVLPWRLRAPLPRLPIPLGRRVPEVAIDLQELFQRAYDNAAMAELVDYRRDTDPPLGGTDAAWADELLRRAGSRGGNGA